MGITNFVKEAFELYRKSGGTFYQFADDNSGNQPLLVNSFFGQLSICSKQFLSGSKGFIINTLKTVVLYSSGHLGSATIFNKLLNMPEFEIVTLVKSQPLTFTAAGARKIRRHLKKMGWQFAWLLFWQQTIQGFGYLINLIFHFNRRQLLPAWLLAKERDVPIIKCTSINDPNVVRLIKELNPDLIISAYFNQILKPDIIAIPKQGILNVHPGWLPAYRGAMTYFWVLKNGSDSAGVSVHWIDEGVDTGDVVARRSFTIKPGMTQQHVLSITAVIGARLLKRIGAKLLSGTTPETIAVDTQNASYYPLPGSDEFHDYFRSRRFFRIRDLLRYILRI